MSTRWPKSLSLATSVVKNKSLKFIVEMILHFFWQIREICWAQETAHMEFIVTWGLKAHLSNRVTIDIILVQFLFRILEGTWSLSFQLERTMLRLSTWMENSGLGVPTTTANAPPILRLSPDLFAHLTWKSVLWHVEASILLLSPHQTQYILGETTSLDNLGLP